MYFLSLPILKLFQEMCFLSSALKFCQCRTGVVVFKHPSLPLPNQCGWAVTAKSPKPYHKQSHQANVLRCCIHLLLTYLFQSMQYHNMCLHTSPSARIVCGTRIWAGEGEGGESGKERMWVGPLVDKLRLQVSPKVGGRGSGDGGVCGRGERGEVIAPKANAEMQHVKKYTRTQFVTAWL